MADVRSSFSYDGNFGPLQTQIRSLVKDITVLNSAFKSLDVQSNKVRNARAGSFMSSLGNIGGFNAQIVDLTSDVQRFGKALQKNQLTLRQYYKEAAGAYKKNSMARRLAEDEVRRAQSQLVGMGQNRAGRQQGMLITPLTIDTSDISSKMAISQKQFAIFNKLVNDGATQLINWGKNTQWAGRQLTVGLTVPLTIFGAAVSKTFREVDRELTRFAKVYGSDLVGANKEATEAIKNQVEDLSKSFAGKFGIAAKETAGLAADLAATGLEGQKLLDSVAQTTRLAVLGEVDRQQAMKATLALQNAFNMSTTELAESINFLNAVENQTSASLEDLTEAIPRVGPVINALGGDVKDLSVLLVAMKEGGVNAAEGANAIKSGLASLINPTRQATETAKKYGISLDEIVKGNKGKLMPTVLAFQDALSGLDEFAKAQIIEQLFGKYQFARISALFDNLNSSGSQTVEVLKLMGASSQELAEIADGEIRTLTESSSMRFQRSMEAIKASLLPVGEVLTNSVIPFLEKTATLIQMFVEYASNLPGPIKNFLKIATGFTLVAGPIIMLIGVFANFAGYITKSAMSITRLGAALAGLRTEKFEVLDDQQLAASKASDVLASAYNNQKASLEKLNGTLAIYLRNLREEVRLSNQLFMPGTASAGRSTRGGGKKSKLQEGGQPYVPGNGNGDKVPALLEPGEFVVNKKAAKKFGPMLEDINFNQAPRFQNGGPIGLIRGGGKPLFLGMPEKFSERIGNVRGLLKKSDQEAKTGRFASMPLTELGTRTSSIGGFSSAIPGVNGVYEINGKRYVVKGHTDSDSALVEARGTQLTRDIFGLKTPDQEVIKIAHPKTGEQMFAVRSPYDEAFAKSTGKINPEDFSSQALASIIRRDNDLQPDNLFGKIVTDVGSGFVANRASQPRTVGGPKTPVEEQALINFLAQKGGAKKWFAESTGDIARSMTPQQYESMFLAKIDDALGKTKGAINKLPNMTPAEKKMYQGIVTDLQDAKNIDWRALHAHHSGLSLTAAKSPTAAALAKKQAQDAEKARQRGHAVGTGGMPWAYANGGFIKLIEGGKVPGYKELDNLIKTNVKSGSQPSVDDWLSKTLSRIDNEKDAKIVVDALTKRLKTGTGQTRTGLINNDLLLELGKKFKSSKSEKSKSMVNKLGRLTSKPGRDKTGTGRPAEIDRRRKESLDIINPMEAAIKARLKESGRFSDSEIERFAKIEAGHLKKDTVTINGKQYKRWLPPNVSWMPHAENLAFEYITRGGPNTKKFEAALKEAQATPNQIKSILSGNHPTSGAARQRFLSALSILEANGTLTPKALSYVQATNALNGDDPAYSLTRGIGKKGESFPTDIDDPEMKKYIGSSPVGGSKGKGKTKAIDAKSGKPATKKSVKNHQRGGKTVVIDSTETVADKNFTLLAENGLDDGTDIKAQRKAVRGQKAGAIGGLAMTGAFMLPALTGTNEALSGFTNSLTTAMIALSAITTIAQVRGIGGVGMGMGAKAKSLRAAADVSFSRQFNKEGVRYRPGVERSATGQMTAAGTSMANARQQVGAGRVMGGLASKAGGTGKGAALARGTLSAIGLATGPVGMAVLAAIALGTAAFVAYQKSIDNAKKAGESLYAEQTKAAEYYGIELQNVNTAMAENVKIAKEMGLAKAPTAATVDPALKQSILEQEENKKLVEEIKKSNDPASIFLGQYGKMLQQGFSPDQAKEVLSILAQASGKMGALQGISGTLNSTVVTGKDGEIDAQATAIKATEAVGQAAIGNINNLFSKKMPSGLSFTDTSTGQVYNTREQALEARGLPEFASLDTMSQKEFNLLTETERQQAKDNGAFITNRTEGEMVATNLSGKADFANLTGQITMAFKSALMSPDLGVGFETMGATIEATFKKGAETGTNQADIADALGESAKAMAKDLGFEEDSKFVETMNAALTDTEDKVQGTKDQFLLVQAAAAGIDLTTIIADGKLAADEAERLRTQMAAIDTQKQINITVNTQIQDAIDAIDKEIQVRTAYYDQLIANNEEAQDSENERTKNFQKNMEKRNKAIQKEIKEIKKAADEQIDAKEKEIDVIEESSDKYLESLESQKEESSFFASQRQTALGGLSSLASGDVVGFLQAREEMAAASKENSQQNEIDKIEQITEARITDIEKTIDAIKEQADAEIGTLQEQLEKNQELMDKEGERHEKRMESLQKEALKIQQNKSAEIKAFDDAKGKLQELMDMPVGEKLGKDLGAYADAISEVASNMPASAQDTMTKLATSFGDNFQSVFDAELAASAAEYGVDPTQLKDLIKRSLPGKDLPPHKRARGGYISGPGTSTSDSIPTMLSNGEYVVKADSVKRIGKGTLDKINSGSGGMSTRYGGMATRTDTTEGYRVGGGEAISAASAFAGGVKTAVAAINAGNALASAAAGAMNEEPENSDGGGTGKTTSIPEQLGKVARILRGNYRVSARGTYPASGNKHSARYSTAIDYATPTGTGVYAMAGGTASNLNKGNSSFGKYVTIKHADGTESLYAHLDSHGKGGLVKAGDFIGETGNSGNSTGPHLHFEWSALKNGFNPPGMRIGGETTSDGIAKLHKGEMVLTKPLTQTLKDGISDLRFGVPSAPSTSGVGSSGTIVSDNRVINVNVNASGSGMNPDMVAQRIVSAINKQENRRSFGRFS
jgi:TP901 family phage tail tape measure protein